MDRTIWGVIAVLVRRLDRSHTGGRLTFTDADIVLTFLWAVAHRRPVSWACRRDSWPIFERHVRRPSPARMSRRLRSREVQDLFDRAERVLRPTLLGLVALLLDGKPMRVASHSIDREATFGAYGLRGYKLHAFCDILGRIVSWRVTPMHCYEPEIARRLVRDLPEHAYVLADANYHSSRLFKSCADRGVQLIAPRRKSSRGKGVRRTRNEPSRLRCIDMLEAGGRFGPGILSRRRGIERVFGRLEMNHGLGYLPSSVRGLHRVRLWTQAVVILDLAKRSQPVRLAA